MQRAADGALGLAATCSILRGTAQAQDSGHRQTSEAHTQSHVPADEAGYDPNQTNLNAYAEWLKTEGIPVYRDFAVTDLRALELKPWKRVGGLGAHVNLVGGEGVNTAYVCELLPGTATNPQRYLFEETIYFLDGEGETELWVPKGERFSVKWKAGSVFRQSSFYIRAGGSVKKAADLAGKRVGVPEWAQTAGIYARSYLQHQCGVRLADVRWLQAGVNDAGRREKVALALPDGIEIEHVHDRSLNDMLIAGDLDAVISAREPAGFLDGGKRIERLWQNYRPVEEAYYRETGIFPIMHVVVIKNRTLKRHPWLAMNLFRAFEQAKEGSLKRLSSIVNSRVAIPWLHESYDHARETMGANFWPYGIDPNRKTLEAFLQFCEEQGVTRRRVAVGELFPPEVSSFYKV